MQPPWPLLQMRTSGVPGAGREEASTASLASALPPPCRLVTETKMQEDGPLGTSLLWSALFGLPRSNLGGLGAGEATCPGRELGVADMCSLLGTFRQRTNETVDG